MHNIRNLHKKRLPLMAKLAFGELPVGLKSSQMFQHDLRLLTRVDEESLVALPLCKDGSVVPLPLGAAIKVQPALNADYVCGMKEVERLTERAASQMEELNDKMIVHDVNIGRDSRLQQHSQDNKQGPTRKSSLPQSVSRVSLKGSPTSAIRQYYIDYWIVNHYPSTFCWVGCIFIKKYKTMRCDVGC